MNHSTGEPTFHEGSLGNIFRRSGTSVYLDETTYRRIAGALVGLQILIKPCPFTGQPQLRRDRPIKVAHSTIKGPFKWCISNDCSAQQLREVAGGLLVNLYRTVT